MNGLNGYVALVYAYTVRVSTSMAITKILTKLDHALRLLPFLGDEQRAALQVRRVRKLVERGESLDDVRVV